MTTVAFPHKDRSESTPGICLGPRVATVLKSFKCIDQEWGRFSEAVRIGCIHSSEQQATISDSEAVRHVAEAVERIRSELGGARKVL